jgi:hypothetical protein
MCISLLSDRIVRDVIRLLHGWSIFIRFMICRGSLSWVCTGLPIVQNATGLKILLGSILLAVNVLTVTGRNIFQLAQTIYSPAFRKIVIPAIMYIHCTGKEPDSITISSGHSSLACTDCHDGQNYQAASRECSSCHLEEYNSTSNPAHIPLNFPLACNECHTTDPGWKPAAYQEHDSKSFPIYSGEHKGEWSSCTDCHTQPSNYSLFSCITCHEHNKADMDNEHRGETGYSWSPMVCLQCHRNGKADK